jgi:hypothetical protein
VAASGTSLGGAWVQVTADASGVAASLRDDVTDATKQIAKVFDQAFAGIEADAEQAAGAVGDSLGEAGDKGSAKMSAALEGGGGGFIDKVKGIAAGAAAAFGVAFAIDNYLDFSDVGAKLNAQMGTFGEGAGQAGKVAGDIYADNFGGSIDEVGDAVVRVSQSLGMALDDADLKPVTEGVLTLSSAFGTDLAGTTNAVAQLMRTGLAPNAQAALDIITVGFQDGANLTDDYLDTLNEYSVQFQQLGLDGADATGLLVQGLQAGARNTDLVADALKEFLNQAGSGSTTAAAGYKILGLNAADMQKRISAGGQSAKDALQQTIAALRDVENPADQSAAAVGLFGTQAEDLRKSLFALDPATAGAIGGLDKTAGATKAAGDAMSDTVGSKIETLKRGLQTLAVDALGGLITGFTDGESSGEGLAGTMSSLGATVRDVTDWLGEHTGVLTGIGVVVGVVLLPILAAWGVAAVVNAAKNVVAWLSVAFTASGSAAAQEASAAQVGLSWLTMGARAVLTAARIAVVWVAQTAWATATTGRRLGVDRGQHSRVLDGDGRAGGGPGVAVAAVWIAQTAWATATLVAGWAWAAATTLASWTLMGAQAVIRGAVIAAVWIAQTAATVGPMVLAWGIAVATVVAGWVLMAAQALIQGVAIAAVWTAQVVASAVTGAASFAVQVARVIGGWLLMAAGAMTNAVIMAAAWFIALGPVGWVIAAVIALVALVIANWDRVKAFTVAAWNAIGGVIGAVVAWIQGAVSAGLAWLLNLFLNWTPLGIIISHWAEIQNAFLAGVNAVVGFVTALPGRVLGGLAGFGSLLYGKGRELMQGLVDGIASAASFVGNVARNIVNAVIRFINEQAINGINRLLEFSIAGVHINPPDIPHIPLLAAGAVVTRPTLAVVGEAGPEVVLPLSASRATRRGQLMEQAGIGGTPTTIDARQYYEVRDTQTAEEVGAIVGQRVVHDVRNGITGAYAGAVA